MWLAVAFCSKPLALSFFDSLNVVRYFEFIVDKTEKRISQLIVIASTSTHFNSPFFTVFDGFKLPDCNCWDARFNPLDKSCSARINNINRSARLQCSGAWGWVRFWTVGDSLADIRADNGAHRESATSSMQSVRARTKLSFANVSLWSRWNGIELSSNDYLRHQ